MQIDIKSNGHSITGWTSLVYTASLDALAPSLTLSHTELWGEADKELPLRCGDEIELEVDGVLIMTGYIDTDSINYDANTIQLSYSARAKTSDLVDCSARLPSMTIYGQTLTQLATKLCDPYGISIDTADGASVGAKFVRVAIQTGETVHEIIERCARMRGLLLQTTPTGDLLLGVEYQEIGGELALGANILRGSRETSYSDRYSNYRVIAQVTSTDDNYGTNATKIARTSTDPGIERTRNIDIMAESEDSGNEVATRVLWEAKVRRARSKRITYTVADWHNQDGDVWRPGMLIKVVDHLARVDGVLTIASVSLSLDSNGALATLEMAERGAYDAQPLYPEPVQDTNKGYL